MFKFKEFAANSAWPIAILLLLALSTLGDARLYGFGGGNGGSYGNSYGGLGGKFINKGITFIEDQSNTGGLFAYSSDFNFAILSQLLAPLNWAAVSVNGNQVFVTLLNNLTLSTTLTSLNSSTVDLITSIKSNFLTNLVGVTLSTGAITQPNYNYGYSNKGGISGFGNGYSLQNGAPSSLNGNGGFSTYNSALSGTSFLFNTNPNYNLFNLANNRALSQALAGDIYYVDLIGNILDVYTTDISVKGSNSVSIIFYDETFFSYSCLNLPLNINRIFVDTYLVFFVYNDATIVIKSLASLNPIELSIVLGATSMIQGIDNYETNAAAATNGFGGAPTTSTTNGASLGGDPTTNSGTSTTGSDTTGSSGTSITGDPTVDGLLGTLGGLGSALDGGSGSPDTSPGTTTSGLDSTLTNELGSLGGLGSALSGGSGSPGTSLGTTTSGLDSALTNELGSLGGLGSALSGGSGSPGTSLGTTTSGLDSALTNELGSLGGLGSALGGGSGSPGSSR